MATFLSGPDFDENPRLIESHFSNNFLESQLKPHSEFVADVDHVMNLKDRVSFRLWLIDKFQAGLKSEVNLKVGSNFNAQLTVWDLFKPHVLIKSGGGIHNYLYELKSTAPGPPQMKVEGSNVLGKLQIVWRTNLGELGRLQTQQILGSPVVQFNPYFVETLLHFRSSNFSPTIYPVE